MYLCFLPGIWQFQVAGQVAFDILVVTGSLEGLIVAQLSLCFLKAMHDLYCVFHYVKKKILYYFIFYFYLYRNKTLKCWQDYFFISKES